MRDGKNCTFVTVIVSESTTVVKLLCGHLKDIEKNRIFSPSRRDGGVSVETSRVTGLYPVYKYGLG